MRFTAFNCSFLHFFVGADVRWFEHVHQDVSWQSSIKEIDGLWVSDSISCISGNLLELGDVGIDFSILHFEIFEFDACSFGFLSVLELLSEFDKELIPYGRDIIPCVIKLPPYFSHVSDPSGDVGPSVAATRLKVGYKS